jgi:hypothetical protein
MEDVSQNVGEPVIPSMSTISDTPAPQYPINQVIPSVSTTTAPAVNTVMENKSIKSLVELSGLSGDELCDAYMKSLNFIHNFNKIDITDTLSNMNMDTLTVLHKSLCDQFVSLFPQYKDMRIVNRQASHTITPDIFTIGNCIVNTTVAKDLQ